MALGNLSAPLPRSSKGMSLEVSAGRRQEFVPEVLELTVQLQWPAKNSIQMAGDAIQAILSVHRIYRGLGNIQITGYIMPCSGIILYLYRGLEVFPLFTFSANTHGNGSHIIGGQIVLGLWRVALQYGRRHHGVAIAELNLYPYTEVKQYTKVSGTVASEVPLYFLPVTSQDTHFGNRKQHVLEH